MACFFALDRALITLLTKLLLQGIQKLRPIKQRAP